MIREYDINGNVGDGEDVFVGTVASVVAVDVVFCFLSLCCRRLPVANASGPSLSNIRICKRFENVHRRWLEDPIPVVVVTRSSGNLDGFEQKKKSKYSYQ